MTAKSSSSENTDIDEEKDDISMPGLSHIFKVTWKNKASVKIRYVPFTEQRHQTFPEKRFASNSYSGHETEIRNIQFPEKDRL
ncbi:hypothetical protein TNIN_337801 [Trichonephila inaurata madagascariensis]|uniref:Uncharacterized protein n=1 Tax=Trichonephila inaurata madagascariensis TaxID=2747483 RepID=A0A8X6WRH8_9ARAC|nr:hypothetical protein TNIN_337801 [Trichonephila inaurata madagascariensis]